MKEKMMTVLTSPEGRARASVAQGMQSLGSSMGGGAPGYGGGGNGLGTLLSSAVQLAANALSGSPGRAIGGPVAPGRAYRVGENGPEWFVPTASGRVETGAGERAGARDIRITVHVNGGEGGRGTDRMQATGRQIARAVRSAIEDAG